MEAAFEFGSVMRMELQRRRDEEVSLRIRGARMNLDYGLRGLCERVQAHLNARNRWREDRGVARRAADGVSARYLALDAGVQSGPYGQMLLRIKARLAERTFLPPAVESTLDYVLWSCQTLLQEISRLEALASSASGGWFTSEAQSAKHFAFHARREVIEIRANYGSPEHRRLLYC